MPEIPSDIPSDFKEFVYEPSYEQEVVSIFFSVLRELDLPICIDEVRGKFPDCLAWKMTENGYERFNIEFELYSQNFREHEHDPEKCDLIVCWEDNWTGCPVEVLELKEEIESLDGKHVYLDEPKFTKQVWTEEKFFNKVEEKHPQLLEKQRELFEALEDDERINIYMGEGSKFGSYSIHLPSTDSEVWMGIREDGIIEIAFKEFHGDGRKSLAEAFMEKLGIRIDTEKDWMRVLSLEEDLNKEDLEELLNIILEEDFTESTG